MQIVIHRKAGPFGRHTPLDVLVDGEKVLSLAEGEEVVVTVSSEHSHIAVSMQGQVGSPNLLLTGEHTNFQCGARRWLALDVFDLCYLPALRQRVFFLRPVQVIS